MDTLALLITIIGALNWGLVSLFQFDLVAWIGGGQAGISRRRRLHVSPVRIPYSPTKNDE